MRILCILFLTAMVAITIERCRCEYLLVAVEDDNHFRKPKNDDSRKDDDDFRQPKNDDFRETPGLPCEGRPTEGMCDMAISGITFDPVSKTCKNYDDSGCTVTKNSFPTLEECETKCKSEMQSRSACPGGCAGGTVCCYFFGYFACAPGCRLGK